MRTIEAEHIEHNSELFSLLKLARHELPQGTYYLKA